MSVLTIALLSGSAAAQVEISDGTFAPADWTHTILYSMPTATLGPMTQESSGGNPDFYQRGQHNTNGPFASIWDAHAYTPRPYNPASEGAIQSVDISYDLINLTPGSIQSGLFVAQGGRTFFRYVDSNDHVIWSSVGVTGIAGNDNQWQEATATGISNAAPDFSASGAPITFGYYTFNWSLPTGFNILRTWGLDNFRVVVHGEGPAPCYANCDGSTAPPVLNVNDFICFQAAFAAGNSYANCDASSVPPVLNVNDFVCFQVRFAAGCE